MSVRGRQSRPGEERKAMGDSGPKTTRRVSLIAHRSSPIAYRAAMIEMKV